MNLDSFKNEMLQSIAEAQKERAKQYPIKVIDTPHLTTEWTLKIWVIDGPFHALWHQWTVTLFHLRGELDGKPAELEFEGATHQLIIQSINPDANPLDENSKECDCLMMVDGVKQSIGLHPMDVSQQFKAANDAEALIRVDILMDLVKKGIISPDRDFRKRWEHLLTDCGTMEVMVANARGTLQ